MTILATDVVDQLRPADLTHVDVEIGHLIAIRVEEPLEIEPIAQRVEVRDAQAIPDHRTTSASAGRRRYPLRMGMPHHVPNNQEVAAKALLGDHLKLVVDAFADLVAQLSVPLRRPRVHQVAQVLLGRLSIRRPEDRHVSLGEVQVQIAHVRHAQRVGEGLRILTKERLHLLRRLQIELVGREAEPILVIEESAGADAAEHVVGLDVVVVQIVHIIGDDAADAEATCDIRQLGIDGLLFGHTMVLQLDAEPVRPEDGKIGFGDLLSGRSILVDQRLRDLAA